MLHPQELLNRFLLSKEAAGLAERTVVWYREQITAYLNWLNKHDHLDLYDPGAVEEFLAHERRRKLAATTVQARYRALSAWFNWLVRRRLIAESDNPMQTIDRPVIPKKKMRHVTLADFVRLYRSIQSNSWLDYRDREIVLLLLFSGLRVSELINLTPDDVNVAERMVHVRQGKGGNERYVPCAGDVARIHARYLMARPAYPGPELFVSHDGYQEARGPLTTNGVRQMLRRRCATAQLPALNPHAFRHGFGMLFLNAGMELSAVSEAMGHSSEQTTRIYARWLKEGLTQAYEKTMRRFHLPGMDD